MNILIISSLLPYPLNSGGAQAQYNMIDHLRRGHQVTFLFTEDGHNSMAHLRQLQRLWPEVRFRPFRYIRQMRYPQFVKDKAIRALKLRFTPQSERFKVERILQPYGVYLSRDFVSFVRQAVKEAQASVVEVDFYPCMGIVRHLPRQIKTVFIQHEIRFVRNSRILEGYRLTDKEKALAARIKAEEIADMNRYDQVVTLTDTDKHILQEAGVATSILVSPAGINSPLCPYHEDSGKLVFVGAYRHIPNQEGMEWFMREVAPQLALPTPPSLDIIGAGWPALFDKAPIAVSRKGYVEHLADATMGATMIIPILTGSGMRMKILEAAALCLPFVTTTVGVEGLDFRHGESCLIADTPDQFAAAIRQLAADPTLRRRIATTAQEVFKARYSTEALGKIREAILTGDSAAQPEEPR